MEKRRWEGDAIGIGVADGGVHLPEIQPLCEALTQPGWIAEDPETHLLPHLIRACNAADSPWALTTAAMGADGVLLVDLTWTGVGSLRALRRDLFTLAGEIAEAATHIRQAHRADALEYLVCTGMLTGDGPFAGHGHLLTFRVEGSRVPALLAGMADRPLRL